ncbi:hypothetical protein ABZ714_14985 [Streptomyces sp. NPDC006798]|uniref:hypothetical protein n=1 Tax=Streptomyces sp. NPDC006798 TaxID=3155462 RepID=UPI00340B31AD
MTEPMSRRRALGLTAAAGAAALLAAGTAAAAPTAAARPTRPAARRAPVLDGVYGISRPEEELLTLLEPRDSVVVLQPGGQPGDQEWQARTLPNGNVTLRNLRWNTYAGYEGDPRRGRFVVGTDRPVEWSLRQSAERYTFHVVVPGGPVDGAELAIDLSPLLIFPPRTALETLRPHDVRQAWRFHFHE